MTTIPYRLPDGQILTLDEAQTAGAADIEITTADGRTIYASRATDLEPEPVPAPRAGEPVTYYGGRLLAFLVLRPGAVYLLDADQLRHADAAGLLMASAPELTPQIRDNISAARQRIQRRAASLAAAEAAQTAADAEAGPCPAAGPDEGQPARLTPPWPGQRPPAVALTPSRPAAGAARPRVEF